MAKKKKEEKVIPLHAEETSKELSMEEMEAVVKEQDEKELQGYIDQYMASHSLSGPLGVEEEEEEIITLDFEKGIATQKIVEGCIDASGSVHYGIPEPKITVHPSKLYVEDLACESLAEGEQMNLDEWVEKKVEGLHQSKTFEYRHLVTDIFVRKAIASLLAKTSKALDEYRDFIEKAPDHMRQQLDKTEMQLDAQKSQLRMAIRGNVVHYEDIPEWAEGYIREYIEDAIGTLLGLVERD